MEVSHSPSQEAAGNVGVSAGSIIATYTREEMMLIKDTLLAQERPGFLSTDFNDEKGLFAPDKWFDHTFGHDVHKPVVPGRKKVLNRGEEELGLSPQRRQFAGGCVPGSAKPEQGNSKLWRNGKTGIRDENKNESQRWKHNSKDSERQPRDRQRSHLSNNEEMPEWLDSKVSVNDVIELKGFDAGPLDSPTTPKSNKVPLTPPKFDELQLLKELQRSDTSSATSSHTSGSRFINFFKRNQENQHQDIPVFPGSETLKRDNQSKSSNLNDLFGAGQSWPEMPPTAGILASDIESRFQNVGIRDEIPTLLPELAEVIRNPPEVHVKSSSSSMGLSQWEDDYLSTFMPKHDVYRGQEKESSKLIHELESTIDEEEGKISPMPSIWDSNKSMKQKIDEELNSLIHGLNQTPDLFSSDYDVLHQRRQSISPPTEHPPPFLFDNEPPRSPTNHQQHMPQMMSSPFARMPFPMPPMGSNGMPMMRLPFYPFPPGLMNPGQMAPNGMPFPFPPPPGLSSTSTSSNSNQAPSNLPTSVLLRMKRDNPSSANSQRSLQSPELFRKDSNLSSPHLFDRPQSRTARKNSSALSDNGSTSNDHATINSNNFDPHMFYSFMAQMNMPFPPGLVPPFPNIPFPPGLPPFGSMPPGMPPYPPGMGPPMFSSMSGMPPMPPNSNHVNNTESPKFEMKPDVQAADIPESILRQLPSSARPVTVADLEKNLLSKN